MLTDAAKTHSRFFVTEKLSQDLALTPEGFLLCLNVPIARTGSMLYGPGETDIETGPDGSALVECDESELFRPETIASANGKPIVDEHPTNEDGGVDPTNWSELARGSVLNPRRGGSGQENLLLADFLVTSQEMIEDVLALKPGSLPEYLRTPEGRQSLVEIIKQQAPNVGKREVSCGYDADYEQTSVGHGRKTNIIMNHTAFVGEGRCGATCRVHDHLPRRMRKRHMPKFAELRKRLEKAFKTRDEAGFNAAMEEAEPVMDEASPGGEVHVHVHNGEAAPKVVSGDGAEGEVEGEVKGATEGRSKFTDAELESRFKSIGDSLEEIKGLVGKKAEPAAVAEEGDKPVQDAEGYLVPKEGSTGDGHMKDNKEIEGELEEEAPEGTGDAARKSGDSAYLVQSYRDTVALAEIIAPGVKLPTFDTKWNPRLTYDNLCRLRKKALTLGLNDATTRAMIVSSRGGRTTDAATVGKLTCDSTRLLFNTVGAQKRAANNQAHRTHDTATNVSASKPAGTITSIADLNKRNREAWGVKE